MANSTPNLDCRWSVNDVITRHPMALAVFTRFGLDARCDGTLSVAAAAQANAVDADALCAELHDAARLHWGARQLLKRLSVASIGCGSSVFHPEPSLHDGRGRARYRRGSGEQGIGPARSAECPSLDAEHHAPDTRAP